MKATLRKMGNSQGVLIPKAVIAQLGIRDDLDMVVESNAIILRKPEKPPRAGWEEESKLLAEAGDDKLVWPEFANADDAELVW
ncbi:MAG: AbrB/MazE/SpoVT family DNA-binding domain-containing protein [Methylobacillus sp.]|nr:AbrB/MazE/SpoVT family DNA-binding domain-containing protein [Methylobacillus sp.]